LPLFLADGNIIRREVRFSLRTKLIDEALSIYQTALPEIKSIIREVLLLNKQEAELAAQVEFLKNGISDILSGHIKKLRECAENNNNHWKTSLAERQLKQSILDGFIEPMSEMIIKNQEVKKSASNIELLGLMKTLIASTSTPTSTSDSKPLYKLTEIYLAEKKGLLAPRTYNQVTSNLERFCEVVGFEKDSVSLDSDDLDKYCNVIKNIPKNFNKNNKSIKPSDSKLLSSFWVEAAEDNKGDKLASNGVEKHFSDIRVFLSWCADRHSIPRDYSSFHGLRKSKLIKDEVERTPFSPEQLKLIFGSYLYSDFLKVREQPKDYQFWLPLIAMSTGMRIAEIVGLEKEDIKTIDGVWVFDVNETWNSASRQSSEFNKRKKNKTSSRAIPISQQLINSGFLEYVKRLDKHAMVLSGLKLGKSNKGLGDPASKWFNESFSASIKLNKRSPDGKQGVAFHSFRHGFTTNLDKTVINGNTLNDSERHYITGHGQESVRNKTYSHSAVNFPRLKEFVDAMNHEVDLTNISYKRFSRRTKPKNCNDKV
ncbi:MAG: integrase, partial [Oleiphilaceae bacterium]